MIRPSHSSLTPSEIQPITQVHSTPTHIQIKSRYSPWLTPLAYGLGCWFVLPALFKIRVIGQENLPRSGATILAPTHRSRWDALMVPYAAGRFVTGRDIRFMVTSDEVKGFQGWLIRRLGGFPVNPRQPAIASLRYGLEVLQNREMMVIFPEGGIYRDSTLHPLKPGLARLALQAANQPDLAIQIVPMHLEYSQAMPSWGCEVTIRIGKPLQVDDYNQGAAKQEARRLTADLTDAINQLGDVKPCPELRPESRPESRPEPQLDAYPDAHPEAQLETCLETF